MPSLPYYLRWFLLIVCDNTAVATVGSVDLSFKLSFLTWSIKSKRPKIFLVSAVVMAVHFKDVGKLSICAHSANDTNLNAQQTLNEIISNHSANTLLCLKVHLYLQSHLGSQKIVLCLGFITLSPSVTCFSVRLFADFNLKILCHYCPPNKTTNFGKLLSTISVWYDIY